MPERTRETPTAERAAAEAAPRRDDPELLPFDPAEGQGQVLSASERSAADARTRLDQARVRADEEHRQAQAEIRAQQRALAETELEQQRKAALEGVDSQLGIFEGQVKRMSVDGILHPNWLEMEAARVRAVADALQQDETVPGGCYIVDGRKVDANGNRLD